MRDGRLEGKTKDDPGALPGGAIGQRKPTTVFFEDTFYDRETETSALFAGRDIGLGQTIAILAGQADAVILHDDINSIIALGQRHIDPARKTRLLKPPTTDQLAGVLEDIRQCLTDDVGVAFDNPRRTGVQRDLHCRVRDTLSEDCGTDDFRDIARRELGAGIRANAENSSTIRPICPT